VNLKNYLDYYGWEYAVEVPEQGKAMQIIYTNLQFNYMKAAA